MFAPYESGAERFEAGDLLSAFTRLVQVETCGVRSGRQGETNRAEAGSGHSNHEDPLAGAEGAASTKVPNHCSFTVERVSSARRIAMIQKRIVTFVSGHPIFSKW